MTRRTRGFTLVEVLVAVTLLAILMATALAGIRVVTRSISAGTRAVDRTNKVRVAQEFLRHELMQTLVAPYDQDRTSGQVKVFTGERDRLTFVSPMPGYLGHGGPYVQQIQIARGDRSLRLEFRHALLNGYRKEGAKRVEDGDPVVLVEGIRRAEFSYLGMDETGKVGDWQDTWDRNAAQTPPMLVRLKLEFEPGENQVWPDLVVPLVLDASAGRNPGEPGFGPATF